MKSNGYKQMYFVWIYRISPPSLESLNLDVNEVNSLGVLVFFSEFQCKFGDLREMDIFLSNCQGNKICRFEDGKGNQCSYCEYLKAWGALLSKYTLYLINKNSQSVTLETSVEAPKKPKTLTKEDGQWANVKRTLMLKWKDQ